MSKENTECGHTIAKNIGEKLYCRECNAELEWNELRTYFVLKHKYKKEFETDIADSRMQKIIAMKILLHNVEKSALKRDNKTAFQIIEDCLQEAKYANISLVDIYDALSQNVIALFNEPPLEG